MSPYRLVIDRTTDTIDQRAQHFRNLVVSVVVVSLGSVGWTVGSQNLSPLAGLLLLLPVCGIFFFLDCRLLYHWRSHLLDAWIKKDIDLRAFRDAVSAVPNLPKDTLMGMLDTLPATPDLVAEQRISSSTREAMAASTENIHASQSDIVAIKAVAAAIASGSVVIAVFSRTPKPLSGSVALVLLPIFKWWLRRRQTGTLKARMCAAMAKPDFSNENYTELLAAVGTPLRRSLHAIK